MVLPYLMNESQKKKNNSELSKGIFNKGIGSIEAAKVAAGFHPTTGSAPAIQPFDLGKAYENNQKMNYRQQGIDALKPVEPFKMDLASIQSDPTYQAAMESAKQATQVAEGDISALMNRRGIMDSSVNAQTASNAAQREYGKVNRELLPQLIQDQYKRYMDQNNMNRQYASDMFGVSDMYGNDVQQNFNNAVTESSVTGSYMPPGAREAIDKLTALKATTEQNWMTMTPEERAAARKQGDNIRLSLQAFGVDPDKFGANVSASQATKNVGSAGIKTLAAQGQDYNQMADTRDYNRDVLESDRNFNEGVRQDNRNFQYTQGRDKVADERWQTEFDRIKEQDGIQNALAWASQNLNETEFADSSAYKWAGLDAELAAAASEGEKYQGMSANDVVSNVRKNFEESDGALPSDTASRDQMYMQIIGAGLPQDQEDQALAAIGFTPDQIKSLDAKYLQSGN